MAAAKEYEFFEENLHDYQDTTVDHILDNPFCGVFLDMGMGKTVATLTAVEKLIFDTLEVKKVLIVAPKRVTDYVWTDERDKWHQLQYLKMSRVIGTEKQRKKALSVKAHIYLINIHNIAWLCGLYGGSMLPFDMLVIDESSSFKNHKSVRFSALRKVQPCFKRVAILTGTPAPNGLIDLWSQIYLLDRGKRLGKFIGHFREEYFRVGKRNGHIVYNWKVREDSEQRIYDRIGDICISMKTEDYDIDLPERFDNYIKLKLPAKVAQRYLEFEEEKVLEFYDESIDGITAANAASLTNKLLQFANGAVYDEDKNYHVVHDLKLDALEEILENANGKPVLVGWTYRSDMFRMVKRFKKYKPRTLKTEQDKNDWNAGKIQLLLMHPAGGGHGLNLQYGGSILVWFGQT